MHPGSVVAINFAGSQQLAQQLSQGAPADIYASADKQQMENVIQAGRVTPDSDQAFIHNYLAVVLPGDNPGNIRDIKKFSERRDIFHDRSSAQSIQICLHKPFAKAGVSADTKPFSLTSYQMQDKKPQKRKPG